MTTRNSKTKPRKEAPKSAPETKGRIKAQKPSSIWSAPLTANFKDLFTSMGKALTHGLTLNWVEFTKNSIDALSAIGIEKDAGQIAWLLIHRAAVQAIHALVEENLSLIRGGPAEPSGKRSFQDLCAQLDAALAERSILIDRSFFVSPGQHPLVTDLGQSFARWLIAVGIQQPQAETVADRLPPYFTFALNDEWRNRREEYSILWQALDTPFSSASERELAWSFYSAWLQKQVEEPLFSESFSLRHIYIPLRAFYERVVSTQELQARGRLRRTLRRRTFDEAIPETVEASAAKGSATPPAEEEITERVVVDLADELDAWLHKSDPQDSLRIVSGGPGSGKSSFARMFAATHAGKSNRRVLYIPLHRFDPTDDLLEALHKFVELDGFLPHNPLDAKTGDHRLLIIFDGLDELSMQGKLASEIAQNFVQEVQRKLDRLNIRTARLKILITGRELSVQANINNFRTPQQVLYLLAYHLPSHSIGRWGGREGQDRILEEAFGAEWDRALEGSLMRALKLTSMAVKTQSIEEAYEIVERIKDDEPRPNYFDPTHLLFRDQRHSWWKAYGVLNGRGYESMPKELRRKELDEVTAQPLLNYLVAISFDRGTLDFSEESNINTIYSDLLKSVHQRVWAAYQHPSIADVQHQQYLRILEEIAVAIWHGDGRSTTLRRIEEQCDRSGLGLLLDRFREGAKESVSRLLMAFYFRQSARRAAYEETFEFTHKSFGEYLTAKRIIRSLKVMSDAISRRTDLLETGWDDREALSHWINVCGPVPLDPYLYTFLENEIALQDIGTVKQWQVTLSRLIEFCLQRGIPMEKLEPRPVYYDEARRARNSEEALLVLLAICARRTKRLSKIAWPTSTSFSEWLSRIQGQRKDYENGLTLNSLDYLDLSNALLILRDLFGASLKGSDCHNSNFYQANLAQANLEGANLSVANLALADLQRAFLSLATCDGTIFNGANLEEAFLQCANFHRAALEGANLKNAFALKAFFDDAKLEGANLEFANFDGASLRNVNLERARMQGAQMRGAFLQGANLKNADMRTAYLHEANFEGANLDGANLQGAYIHRAYFEGASLIDTVGPDGALMRPTLKNNSSIS